MNIHKNLLKRFKINLEINTTINILIIKQLQFTKTLFINIKYTNTYVYQYILGYPFFFATFFIRLICFYAFFLFKFTNVKTTLIINQNAINMTTNQRLFFYCNFLLPKKE